MKTTSMRILATIVVLYPALLAFFSGCGDDTTEVTIPVVPIHFADPNLEAVIRAEIGKPSGDIYAWDLYGLSILIAPLMGIRNLQGIEYCINLNEVYLWGNLIYDITPLKGLSKLNRLFLHNNLILDINPLQNLTNLIVLYLGGNLFSDITALQGLTNLAELRLGVNRIADITPLVTNCDAGGLGSGDNVILTGNPLNNQAITHDIPYLQSKGVNVTY